MKYKDIVYNIKDKNFEKIYLLYGKEHYLIDNAIKLFRESLNESMIDFNLETIDGKETTLDQLLSSIETLPFMDERKIVIVKDFELLTKSKKKNFSDKDEKTFASHLENIPDTTILVFAVYGEVDKRKSIVNTISKMELPITVKKYLIWNCLNGLKRNLKKITQ